MRFITGGPKVPSMVCVSMIFTGGAAFATNGKATLIIRMVVLGAANNISSAATLKNFLDMS
jgi:hypothetical protein